MSGPENCPLVGGSTKIGCQICGFEGGGGLSATASTGSLKPINVA